MVETWAADDLLLERRVIVKIPAWSDRDDRVRRLGQLSHRGIVGLLDAGADAGGREFVVTEQLRELQLSDVLAAGPLPPAMACRIGRDLARALAYGHAHGVSHGSISPSTVVVDHHGGARLCDYGLGRSGDPSSDVHSLGLLLQHALTGAGESPPAAHDLPRPWPALLSAMTSSRPASRPSAAVVAACLAEPSGAGVLGRRREPHARVTKRVRLASLSAAAAAVLAVTLALPGALPARGSARPADATPRTLAWDPAAFSRDTSETRVQPGLQLAWSSDPDPIYDALAETGIPDLPPAGWHRTLRFLH